jgi:LTXXQ motif family protein
MKFYDWLTDEQKARFNAIGPSVGKAGAVRTEAQDAACSAQKSGLTELPIERIEDVVRPTGLQQAGLERLSKANDEAIAVPQAACPDTVPQTPVGRLDAVEKRLEAMIQAAKVIQPALQDFYASLSNEQKSSFNMLGQRAQR